MNPKARRVTLPRGRATGRYDSILLISLEALTCSDRETVLSSVGLLDRRDERCRYERHAFWTSIRLRIDFEATMPPPGHSKSPSNAGP